MSVIGGLLHAYLGCAPSTLFFDNKVSSLMKGEDESRVIADDRGEKERQGASFSAAVCLGF